VKNLDFLMIFSWIFCKLKWWMGLKYKTPTIANTKNIIREEKEGPSMLDT
jgi:hypothetical protein